MIRFEVKSVQNKLENDFAASNIMLIFNDKARPSVYIHYSAPLGSWEKRYVELADIDSLADVTTLRIGVNPKGSQCAFWVRNIEILKKKD